MPGLIRSIFQRALRGRDVARRRTWWECVGFLSARQTTCNNDSIQVFIIGTSHPCEWWGPGKYGISPGECEELRVLLPRLCTG